MNPSWTRDQVIATIATQFPAEEREAVLATLDAYPGDTPAGRARIQLAILALAAGDMRKVRDWAAHANVDFRDVLYAANRLDPDHGGLD